MGLRRMNEMSEEQNIQASGQTVSLTLNQNEREVEALLARIKAL
jgi:hypothetical protein